MCVGINCPIEALLRGGAATAASGQAGSMFPSDRVKTALFNMIRRHMLLLLVENQSEFSVSPAWICQTTGEILSDRLTQAGVCCPLCVFCLRLKALELTTNAAMFRTESNSWRNDGITSPDGFPRGNFHRLSGAAAPAALNTVFQLIK